LNASVRVAKDIISSWLPGMVKPGFIIVGTAAIQAARYQRQKQSRRSAVAKGKSVEKGENQLGEISLSHFDSELCNPSPRLPRNLI